MSCDERTSLNVTGGDITDEPRVNLQSLDIRVNEYVGADLPHLSFTYQGINGATNHILNLQHADIEGLDLTHGRLDQGLTLREATVGCLKLDEAVVTGGMDAREVTVTGTVTADEAAFEWDVRFSGATFRDEVRCDKTVFQGDTSFVDTTLHDTACSRNVEASGSSHVLEDHITFTDAMFHDDASLRQALFDYVAPDGVRLTTGSDFEHVEFEGDARFDGVRFNEMADFDGARFDDDAGFTDARFMQLVEFHGVEFSGGSRTTHDDVMFEGTTFGGEAGCKPARFRYSDSKGTVFKGAVSFDHAMFIARIDCYHLHVDGALDLSLAPFGGRASFNDNEFHDTVVAEEATFDSDASLEVVEFQLGVRLGKARFEEDVRFNTATLRGLASFRGAFFQSGLQHPEASASLDGTTFEASAEFETANFTSASLWETTFHDWADFRQSDFRVAYFCVLVDDRDIYLGFTGAAFDDGTISQGSGGPTPYDLTRATIGDLTLEGGGNEHQLLDHFHSCLIKPDRLDLSDHHDYLGRNDWTIHDFVGNGATGQFTVGLTPDITEETYRKVQGSANTVDDTPANCEFESKCYYYNRQKNLGIILNEYSLNMWTRGKKVASVRLNTLMQVICGYDNRLPRIAAFTFLLLALFGLYYALDGPFLMQTGSVFDPAAVDKTTMEVPFDNTYYNYISSSTVGYGDISPLEPAARVLATSQRMLDGLLFTLFTFTLFKRILGGN